MRPGAGVVRSALVGTLAYLALAVLGWGGVGAFSSHPARTAVAIVTVALSVAGLFSGANLNPGVREDRANRWVLVAFLALGLLAGYLPAYTDRTELWTLDGDTVRWLGVGLFAAGGCCGSGPCSFSAVGSAGSSRSSPGTRWSPLVSTESSATQLSGAARELRGVGPHLSLRCRRAADRPHGPAAARTHPSGRNAAAHSVRCGV